MLGSHPAQGTVKLLAQSGHGEGRSPAFGDEVVIRRCEQFLVKTKELAQESLDPVPDHGVPDLATHRRAEPGLPLRPLGPDDDEVLRVELAPTVGQLEELAAGAQPLLLRKAVPGLDHDYLVAIVTARRLRPLARRRLITSRPFFVDIRTRKPWVLLRDTLLG